jgi:hypothetical protein
VLALPASGGLLWRACCSFVDEVRLSKVIAGFVAIGVLGSASIWFFAAEAHGLLPPGNFVAHKEQRWFLTGAEAASRRRDALTRASIRLDHPDAIGPPLPSNRDGDLPVNTPVVCRFISDEPTGTSAKFDCVLDGGAVVKVKYSRNPEINAETAASKLLRTLGYAADHVRIVPWLRCYGCPRYPFVTLQLLSLARSTDMLGPHGYASAYTDFEWVAVESRFDAPAIESDTQQGWAWFELEASHAPQSDLDAFRLLAVFLAHWDNKSENQRLVCLDTFPGATLEPCARPLLMIQDLGATFGPLKVDLAEWSSRPIWDDRSRCTVSMRSLPYRGATFGDARISEGGRVQLGRQLSALSSEDIRKLFSDARFHAFYSGTDDEKDIAAWTAAFRRRVDQIVNTGPCPGANGVAEPSSVTAVRESARSRP